MSDVMIRLPDHLLTVARTAADEARQPLEHYMSELVQRELRLEAYWQQRVERGKTISREQYLEILAKAPDVPPIPGDEIE